MPLPRTRGRNRVGSLSRAVLITGARAPVAQDLARAARAARYDVHLADSVPSHAARALQPAFPFSRLPSPRQDFAQYRQALLRLIERTNADHVVPTCEEVFWLSEAAARDGYADKLFAPDLATLARLHSKIAFAGFAAGLGIAVPETLALEGPVDPVALPFPLAECVAKPEFSRFATHTLIAPSAAQWARLAPGASNRWAVQRRIVGEEVCCWTALHRGSITAFAAYRPRWRQGQAAAFQLEALDLPKVHDIVQRIGAATGMTGHLSLDIIIDAAGVPHPIECNPRAVSGLHLFDASADMARAVIEGTPCAEPEPGLLRHLGPAMALLGLPAALMRGRLRAFRTDWRCSRDVIDREGNMRQTWGCLADAAGFALHALRARRSPAGATTLDIEWDGETIP